MSPSTGDVATPEPKTSSGFASVFKSLTGGRSTKGSNAPSPASALQLNGGRTQPQTNCGGPPNYELLYERLKVENELADRVAAAETLRAAVKDFPLSGVTSIFKEGKDLIDAANPKEARVIGFELLTACVQQSTSTDPERLAYFHVLTAPANPEDFYLQVMSLVELAENGKNLAGFHYETLPLLTSWLREGFETTLVARKIVGRPRKSKDKAPLGEETTFALLFAFVVDVIKFSFNVSSEETTGELIDVVLHICTTTTVQGDLCASINIINAIVTYGDIPNDKLLDCVKVLCSIHCLVDTVQEEAWHSISNLCISHNGETTVRILLDILREPSQDGTSGKQVLREIRGALSVLDKLFAMDGKEGYPLVPFTLLMASLTKVVTIEHTKVQNDVLRLVLSLFEPNEEEEIKMNVVEEDWSVLFAIVQTCAQGVLITANGSMASIRSSRNILGGEITKQPSGTTSLAQTLYRLIVRIESLLVKFSSIDFFQREDCIQFLVAVHEHLPETCANLVIDYYIDYRCCSPSDLRWKENTRLILDAFFADRTQPTSIRLLALKAVTQIFEEIEVVEKHEEPETVQIFVTTVLENIHGEKDAAVLQEVVAFAVSVSDTQDIRLFDEVINTIRSSVFSDQPSPLGSPTSPRQGFSMGGRPLSAITQVSTVQTPASINTRGLVDVFMREMYTSPPKAMQVFKYLLDIAKSHQCETDARLSALKMLCRLRADWADRIFLTPFTESEGLAATLYRTPGSLARKQATDEAASQLRHSRVEETPSTRMSRSTSFGNGQPPTRQPTRTASGVSRSVQRTFQMLWMEPDPDALPKPATGKASSLLLSALEITNAESDVASNYEPEGPERNDVATFAEIARPTGSGQEDKATLDIALYLETIIDLIQNRCEWEVYSYILVHLSSQLTNQALFNSAIPQIKILRELLCDQIKNSTFQEPPISSGLRKADVAICFFQILTMLMSYHQHFTTPEKDEIVRTFVQGVGERTSKCCIHALSICCHELPGSTSKVLVTILTKMSQIITQSHVAVHILDFLACLARMPSLYVNFREEEYRIVFAICFRYLQYVRDQQEKDNPRNSNSVGRLSGISVDTSRTLIDSSAESNFQPNTSDELPQYVYALAYHVIIFWFLSLRMLDRDKHVSWIVRSLVTIDSNGREKIDEQAEVTLDFMQRAAYADVDESAPDPSFNEMNMGRILKQRWIVGNSLITIEQSTRTNLAQITRRQPSGTSSWRISETYESQPAHQSQVTVDSIKDAAALESTIKLPGHLLQQLMVPYPLRSANMRPIPLPDDAHMKRAVKNFNTLFTVDSHKVGVIYIGENQTDEVEILANIQGSSDYTKFLSDLGTLTKLREANFNTQGLDRSERGMDGEYTYCWRDRVTEIVFHVVTQMPTDLVKDPRCTSKKKHIGNDFVNIIFNNSGLPFKFNTFPSQLNYVNIVITPESRASFVAKRIRSKVNSDIAFYRVQVMSKPGFPEISPAAETKIVSLSSLPNLIRLMALNASVFSHVWDNSAGGEHVSSWLRRLREINKLREKYARPPTSTPASPPGTSNGIHESRSAVNVRDSLNSLRRSSVANFLSNTNNDVSSQRNSILSTTETEVGPGGGEESMIDSLDFSKWSGAAGQS